MAVAGGSLAGLSAALVLRDLGVTVDVYERSATLLEGRGVGIVLHPATVRYLRTRAGTDLSRVSSVASAHRYLDRSGAVVSEVARRHAFTAYNTLYRALLDAFDEASYHLGHRIADFDGTAERVRLTFDSQPPAEAELLVGADGISSTVRRKLLPNLVPSYAGYVAWRAVVEERALPAEDLHLLADSLTYFIGRNSHALTYPIPHLDGCVEPGGRLVNLVWYRNAAAGPELDALLTDRSGALREVSVPPGAVRDDLITALRAQARSELPPVFARVVELAEEPFLQVLFDVAVPRMAFGRVALIGDAAFAVRPHAATATAKGAEDAWALAEALQTESGDVVRALEAWEPAQLQLGRNLLERNRRMGDDVQFRAAWRPGDPRLAFGLRQPGDSAGLTL